jgi:indole-3-glycerol phosphate synthase
MTILAKIVQEKRIETARSKEALPEKLLKERVINRQYNTDLADKLPAGPRGSFKKALAAPGISLISEVKKASPSKGVFKKDLNPAETALIYERAGAAAVSVLTDTKFFQGSLQDMVAVKSAIALPVLRKDFIIDAYQLYEARYYGADAVLLIAAILDNAHLQNFIHLAHGLGLDALVEVHSKGELQAALDCGAEIIGINNRDLETFKTSIATTMELAQYIPDSCILVSESGISTYEDVKELASVGVDAILVGEALITSPDIEGKVKELLEGYAPGGYPL